jgi:hypothetical protein
MTVSSLRKEQDKRIATELHRQPYVAPVKQAGISIQTGKKLTAKDFGTEQDNGAMGGGGSAGVGGPGT